MSDDSFLREVEDELRSEKLKAFWRRFAPVIIGAAVLVVLLVAANEVWKWWRSSTAATASASYYEAVRFIEAGDIPSAQAALSGIVADGPGGYATLARFHEAALRAQSGDPEGAIAAYDALAASQSNRRLRDLAYVMGAYLAVDHLDAPAVEARVGALAADDNPLRNNAREALGLAYYLAGDYQNAGANFQAIAADPLAGQDTQIRAYVYLEQLASTGEIAPPSDPDAAIGLTDLDALGAPLVEPVPE